MPRYMYEVAYTPPSLAAQIKEPHERIEAVRPVLEATGIKILVGGYQPGEYDVMIVIDAPDDTTAVASRACSAARDGDL
jgi:uncharacterized protein with GYD domain